jgi:hypothetical protein
MPRARPVTLRDGIAEIDLLLWVINVGQTARGPRINVTGRTT